MTAALSTQMHAPTMAGPGDGNVPESEYSPFKPVTQKRVHKQAVEENKDDDSDKNESNKKKKPIELPLPMNGKEYGMGEFLDLVTQQQL
jgi:hypothetical protein